MKPVYRIALFMTLLLSQQAFSQMTIVVMGSSTAFGAGASVYDSAWVGRFTTFSSRNISDGKDTTIYNIAASGYDTYQEMPGWFTPPSGRPTPDMDYNVTKALSFNPDVVVINLPSNDISYGYSKEEMICNLRIMYNTINASGAHCFVATPQPRNDFPQDYRDSLLALVDSVNLSFGLYAIDFWSPIVTTDGSNMLRMEYQSVSGQAHVNDDGHAILFNKVKDAVFGFSIVGLQVSGFTAQLQDRSVLIKWHAEQQEANTKYDLQRSADGRTYSTIYTENITAPRLSFNYSTRDQQPFTGRMFYRLKITEPARTWYSQVVFVSNADKALDISKLYSNASGTVLTAEITVQKNQQADISIININGAVLSRQQELIAQPAGIISLPINYLPAGQYYLRVVGTDGKVVTKAFRK